MTKEVFGDLDGVEGGPFAQVVGDDPAEEGVRLNRVRPKTAHEDLVPVGGIGRHRIGGFFHEGDAGTLP